jgi:hypothetical protein
MKAGYIPQQQRKKILLLSDDIRMQSGIATMAREIVVGTSHRFNWVNLGAGINHPEHGKRLDLSLDTNGHNDIEDSSIIMYPHNGYGSPEVIRQLIDIEKPDAIMFFTDPRYWIWLFQMENEIRRKIPMIYLNIWDDLPAPLYNEPYYESCDALMAISKQTLNINKLVLGPKQEGKVLRYIPHGINPKHFYPIDKTDKEQNDRFTAFKKTIFGEKDYEYVVFYNARNIRRKSTSDLILAYRQFCEKIGEEKAKKCVLLLHTQPIDENGTDLLAVKDLLCDPELCNVVITDKVYGVQEMNYLYNLADVTALISSNEGWGLSLTESLITGTMIIGNVTGGMQDQMRFEDEEGNWIDFDENFCSNHFGTYKKCGEWAVPVFPSNLSLVGSVPTPYIFDDRCDFREVAQAIEQVYNLPKSIRESKGMKGREWVMSSEAKMTSPHMCENVIETLEETFITFKPRPSFQFIEAKDIPKKQIRHKLTY